MIAKLLPAKIRATVYAIGATAFYVESVWDLVPADFEGKALQTFAILGFTLALSNTNVKTPPAPAWDAPRLPAVTR